MDLQKELMEQLEVMCRRCTNYDVCQGTGCYPKNQLQKCIEYTVRSKEKFKDWAVKLP